MPNRPDDDRPDVAAGGTGPGPDGPAAGGGNEFAEQLQRMMADLAGAWATGAGSAAGAAVEAMGDLAGRVRFDPARMVEAQTQLLQDYQRLWMGTTARLLHQGPPADPVIEPAPGDSRFGDAEWSENPVFDYIKQAYLLNAAWAKRMVESIDGLDDDTAQKVDFVSRQIVDAMSPTNFALTNPAVLRETKERRGENLREGAENLAAVLARGKGPLAVEHVPPDAFEIGTDIAVTPGEVVFQNELFQLIQYAPATETVYKRPLLIVPPWINKYYILDLRPRNSFVAWCVAQGYTVFMVSWVNPDGRHRDLGFDDYLRDGVFAALDAIERATEEPEVTAIGYCIGGTLLAMALAWLGAKGESRIRAATFFAAQVDFADGGELRVFTDPSTLKLVEGEVERQGYLDGASMAAALQPAAFQRPRLALRGRELPHGQDPPGVRPPLLECRLHPLSRPPLLRLPAEHVPGEPPLRPRRVRGARPAHRPRRRSHPRLPPGVAPGPHRARRVGLQGDEPVLGSPGASSSPGPDTSRG